MIFINYYLYYRHYFSNLYLQRFAHYLSWLANDSRVEKKKSLPDTTAVANDIDLEQGESTDSTMIINRVNIQGEQESSLQRFVEGLPYPCSYFCLPFGV